MRWLCVLLVVSGCQWVGTQTPGTFESWNLTPAQRDSLGNLYQDYAKVTKENSALCSQISSNNLDLAKLRAERDNQLELNAYLKDELQSMADDLEYVENQFLSLEQSVIRAEESKASAVAAVAEGQLLLEKQQREDPGVLDSLTTIDVSEKLRIADELIKERKFAAAVYYAKRATRIVNMSERRKNIVQDGETRIVSASKANMRNGPGSKFKVVDKLVFGTILVQLDSEKDWFKVQVKDGRSGWIHASLVR